MICCWIDVLLGVCFAVAIAGGWRLGVGPLLVEAVIGPGGGCVFGI